MLIFSLCQLECIFSLKESSIEPVSECKYCLPQPTTGKGQPDGLAKTSPQRLGGKPDSMRTTAGMNPRVPPESRLASFHI